MRFTARAWALRPRRHGAHWRWAPMATACPSPAARRCIPLTPRRCRPTRTLPGGDHAPHSMQAAFLQLVELLQRGGRRPFVARVMPRSRDPVQWTRWAAAGMHDLCACCHGLCRWSTDIQRAPRAVWRDSRPACPRRCARWRARARRRAWGPCRMRTAPLPRPAASPSRRRGSRRRRRVP